MNNIFTRKFIGILISAFILLFNPIKADDLLCDSGECRSVLMGEYIIFIKRDSENSSINYYDYENKNSTFLRNYNNDIKAFKNILKINDTSFLIFGISEGFYFCVHIFSINLFEFILIKNKNFLINK